MSNAGVGQTAGRGKQCGADLGVMLGLTAVARWWRLMPSCATEAACEHHADKRQTATEPEVSIHVGPAPGGEQGTDGGTQRPSQTVNDGHDRRGVCFRRLLLPGHPDMPEPEAMSARGGAAMALPATTDRNVLHRVPHVYHRDDPREPLDVHLGATRTRRRARSSGAVRRVRGGRRPCASYWSLRATVDKHANVGSSFTTAGRRAVLPRQWPARSQPTPGPPSSRSLAAFR